jgi:proteasome assembly chaperone (PAC2) family protein
MVTRFISDAPASAPVLIAGWPGMGHVGIGVVNYLRRRLHARIFARIDTTAYYQPDSIEVENGIGRVPEAPSQTVYHVPEPPLFIFEGASQLSGEPGQRLASELVDICLNHGVSTVYTGAAFAIPASFRQPTEVMGVTTSEAIKVRFPLIGVEPLKEGRVTGLNGLLLGVAQSRGLAGACFLATMPQYAVESPNPRASKAIIRVFERILNTSIDMTEINEAIRETDKMLEEFESRVTEAIRSLKQTLDPKPGRPEGTVADEDEDRPEPHQLMGRIETLFEEAKSDRTKAILLKQELDRWGLFSLYEDRFLDLFDHQTRGPRD